MIILKTVNDLQLYLDEEKLTGRSIGFVPTMGALHAGHLSLIEKARADNALSICSIFLNPTQFNNPDDYEKYPESTTADVALLLRAGCDVLFLPPVTEIYPVGPENATSYDFGYLDTVLEGATRPGHFRGVGQAVARLLEIVRPDALYLGQKDFQQCKVISKLVEILGLSQLNVIVCPTIREADGLAMSSRNRRLSERQRALAATIYQCLVSIESKQGSSPFPVVQKECIDLLTAKGLAPEYVALADVRDLTLLNEYDTARPMVALIAARVGGVRLIDNILLKF